MAKRNKSRAAVPARPAKAPARGPAPRQQAAVSTSTRGPRRERAAAVPMPVQREPAAAAQRWVVAVVAALTALTVLTAGQDPINIPKLTVLLLGAIVLVALSVLRVAAVRELRIPFGPAAWAAYAFLLAALLVTLLAPAHGIAVWGDYRRNIGLLLYVSCGIVFLVTIRVFDLRTVHKLALALAATAVVAGGYALFQRTGVDPISWDNPYHHPIATLGNPDFAGGYLAIALPLILFAAVASVLPLWGRVVAAVAFLGVSLAVWQTGAWQGRLAGVAGVAVVVLAVLRTLAPVVRRVGTAAWFAVAAAGTAAVVAGLARMGPLALLGNKGTLEVRKLYWSAAAKMFSHHPVQGVGMSMYGDHYRAYRSPAAIAALGPSGYTDTPHSVPLAMFADGGLLLGLGYVAFLVAVLWSLVRAFRRHSGNDLLLVGGIGGAWVAYQTQSVISIDMVSLATMHFVLAGALVALGGPLRVWTRPLGARRAHGRRQALADAGAFAVTAVVVVALVAAWLVTQPLRADLASGAARKAEARGDAATALSDQKRATRLAGWQPAYWIDQARLSADAQDYNGAGVAARKALRADPRNSDALTGLARLAAAVGDKDGARHYYRRAIRLDPLNAELQAALAALDKPPAG